MSEQDKKENKKIAERNKIKLKDFMKNNEKKVLEVDKEGNVIVDINDSQQRRWLED